MDRTKVSLGGHFVDFSDKVPEEIMRKFKKVDAKELEALFAKAKGKGQGKYYPGYGNKKYGLRIQGNGIYILDEYDY